MCVCKCVCVSVWEFEYFVNVRKCAYNEVQYICAYGLVPLQGGRGQWAIYYTCPHSSIILFVGLITFIEV